MKSKSGNGRSEGSGDGRRVARVEGEIQRLVAQYLITHTRGEIPGLITVTRVMMPADFRAAKVFVSVLGFEGKFSEIQHILKVHIPDIQRHIGDNLRMRYCPKVSFLEDTSSEKALKVESILRDLSESDPEKKK